MKEKKDDSIMIRFTKKKKWLKQVIQAEADFLEESRNNMILEALAEKFKDKEPEKKVRK
jgi:hypothetical protein